MIDFLDNIDAEMSDGGARVVPIITEIHEVTDNTDIQDDKADDIPILPLRNQRNPAGPLGLPVGTCDPNITLHAWSNHAGRGTHAPAP